ncbi:cysteine-rich receptor-like protein kinase 8 [Tanacetum coccineum]
MTINTNPSTSNPNNNDDINSVHHPLFFHQNDHPGLILISKKLIGSNNYSSWKRSMMIALSERNKLKLINEEFEELQLIHQSGHYRKEPMIWQEEKQRDLPKTPINISTALNTTSRFSLNQNRPNDSTQATHTTQSQSARRTLFRKGVYCTNCGKERHKDEECYKIVGYPPGHPLHNKYIPPDQRTHPPKHTTTNVTALLDETPELNTLASSSADPFVHSRMNQLQNQLNQVLLILQNNPKEFTAFNMPHMSVRYTFIASFKSNVKEVWIIDSGATDHICISLIRMHDVHICSPILVSLPNGQQVKVTTIGHDGSITYGSLFGGLYALSHTLASTPTSPFAASTTQTPSTTLATSTSTTLWHARLGHVMNKEIQALEQNKTWIFTTLPPGKSAIGSKWVFKIKFNANESIERFKARLVAQGCTQKEGIDFKETFALVAKMVTRKYALELLECAEVLDIKPFATPMDTTIKLNDSDGYLLPDPSTYRTLVGKLLYLTITRLDLSFAAQALMIGPAVQQLEDPLQDSTCEISWLKCLLFDLGITVPTPSLVMCDNASTIALANNPIHHARTKHIEIDCYFVRDKIKQGQISLCFVPFRLQIADVLTKGLCRYQHFNCLSKLGICDPYTMSTCGGIKRERITKKRTKNKAKTTKPDTEWKSCEGQSQIKAKDQKSQSQSQPNKSTVKTEAVIEEYYWLQSQPI